MATPKDLIASVAELTGVPIATVIVHDRNLAEAGLRTPALRGRGVSRVTYQDAANLLIAVAASRNVKDSVKTVRDYAELNADSGMQFGEEVRGRTFGDALAALLEAVPTTPERFSGRDSRSDEIVVSIYGPDLSAQIDVRRHGEPARRWQFDTRGWPKSDRPRSGDLTYIAQFTHATLGHVGTLVAGDA